MEEKKCISCEEPVIDYIPPCPLSCMSPKCKTYKKDRVINVKHKPVIWILGGPGAGKSTQCEKIAKQYGYTHIATGDALRAEAASGSVRARCLSNILARGGLVPTDIVLNIIKELMLNALDATWGFIIDGYPRDKAQGLAFEQTIASPVAILYIDVSPDTLTQRLMSNAQKSGRMDDTQETIALRIQTFMIHNQEVLEQYRKKLHMINAEGSPDAVFTSIQAILNPIAAAAGRAALEADSKQAAK